MMQRGPQEAVSILEAEGRYQVQVDGCPVSDSARNPLTLPTSELAEAIAKEWQLSRKEVQPGEMRFTKLAVKAASITDSVRSTMLATIVKYGETDLLCYRSRGPKELVVRQERLWQAPLDWLECCLCIKLICTDGILPIQQDPKEIAKLNSVIASANVYGLAALHTVTMITGSAIIAIALSKDRMTALEAWSAGFLEELYRSEHWGEDEEDRSRRQVLLAEIESSKRFMDMTQIVTDRI